MSVESDVKKAMEQPQAEFDSKGERLPAPKPEPGEPASTPLPARRGRVNP